jgi:hypothetical protein
MNSCEANVSAAMEDLTPLDFLKAVYLNEALPLHARLKAATEAAKYMHLGSRT